MIFLIPKILSGEKIITNRVLTPFREKCNAGDLMYMFEGLRTKDCFKFAIAKVISTVKWNSNDIPKECEAELGVSISPLLYLKWTTFMRMDGFEKYDDFQAYFQGKGMLKCFQFEIIQV
jgi:hypothetical protein